MRETKHTGGLMEFHYPKDYKTERTEVDEMRSKSIREYYEKGKDFLKDISVKLEA